MSMNYSKRESCSSVKSLKSYANFRESVGKVHAFVEKVNKIDAEIEIKSIGKKSKGSKGSATQTLKQSKSMTSLEIEKLTRSN